MSALRHTLASASPRILRLWWLNPAWLFAVVLGTTLLIAFLQGEGAYDRHGTPKYIETKHVLFGIMGILAYMLGARLDARIGGPPRATPSEARRVVRFWFWLTFALTLFGYTFWVTQAIRQGFSVDMLDEIIADAGEAEDMVRNKWFTTIPGVTTCVQFAVPTILLGSWLLVNGERRVIVPMALILSLAVVRALVWQERLTVLELVVPAFVLGLRARVLVRPFAAGLRTLLQLAPLLGVVALLVIFGGAEYFRSWSYYQDQFDSVAEFTVWRVTGYYTSSHNNGAMYLETQEPLPLPYWTLRPLWKFPGMSETPFGYQELTGVDAAETQLTMLDRYGTRELNNEGGLFMPIVDFGLIGGIVFWFAAGFVGGRLYRCFLAGTLAGLTMYPLVVLATLEAPRLLYLSYTRAFPGVVSVLVVLWIASRLPSVVTAVGPRPRIVWRLGDAIRAEDTRHG
jgi:hypothetical protein